MNNDEWKELPRWCPFVTRMWKMKLKGCRFEKHFFLRMINEKVLPHPDNICPLRNVCGVKDDNP